MSDERSNQYIPHTQSHALYSPIYSGLYLQPVQNKRRKKKQYFTKDVENLLYALGDGPVSTDATIQALDELLHEYLVDTCHDLMLYAKSQGRTRIKMNDLVFVLRNDPLKLARYQYVITQNSYIKKMKQMIKDKYLGSEEKRGRKGEEEEFEEFDDEDEEEEEEEGDKKKRKKAKKEKD